MYPFPRVSSVPNLNLVVEHSDIGLADLQRRKERDRRSGVVPISNPSAYAPNSIFADARECSPKQIQCSAIHFLHLCLSWLVTSIFASAPKTNVVSVSSY